MQDEIRFRHALQSNVQRWGLTVRSDHMELMWQHFVLLLEANSEINLTRITDPEQAAVRHYADSLAVAAWCGAALPQARTVLDVGTGGGFPAVPLAICCPRWHVTAIDGTAKKVRCVERFVDRLGLSNCTAVQQRAEHWREPPAPFDLILFRAVGTVSHCLSLARPLCAGGSIVLCHKTDPLPGSEAARVTPAAARAGYRILPNWPYRLTCQDRTFELQLCGCQREL